MIPADKKALYVHLTARLGYFDLPGPSAEGVVVSGPNSGNVRPGGSDVTAGADAWGVPPGVARPMRGAAPFISPDSPTHLLSVVGVRREKAALSCR
jgi:hypothetical protein